MTHPHPAATPLTALATTPATRRPRHLRRAGALLALAAALGASAVGCSKTDQVATDQSTTVAPATSKPAGDASGAGTGSTLGTTPGTRAITTSTTAKTTTSTGAESTTSTTAGSVTTAPATTGSTVAGSAADAAFCAKGAEIQARLKDVDPTKDADALAKYKQVFTELTEAAPPEVAADMQQINTIIQSWTSFDSPPADTEKLDAAGKRVDTWAVAHCGKKFGD